MKEIKTPEIEEIKKPESENFRNIQPEKGMTVEKAKGFWDKEFQKTDIESLKSEYVQDLKDKSDCPDTISETPLDVSDLEVQSPEKVVEMREEFDTKKTDLRTQWEEKHGQSWPKYGEYIYSKNGILIRKPGDPYDAHHIKPLCLGGKNEVNNITPLSVDNHRAIHLKDGSCTKLIDTVGGERNE